MLAESPTAGLLALVCGYAPRERAERYFAMFVCHGDDSRDAANTILVIGGLTAKIDDWIAFTVDWQAALDARPAIDYFKFAEAFNRIGQFSKNRFSITERNARVQRFIKIINRHCFQAEAAMSGVAFLDRPRGKISVTLDNPLVPAYFGLMKLCAFNLTARGVRSTVDFIFDEMSDTTLLEIRRAHRIACENRAEDPAMAGRFGQPPITRDDKVVIALQGADLWAGIVRQSVEDDRAKRVTIARKWKGSVRIPYSIKPPQEARVSALVDKALQIVEENDLKPETGKARSKRLASARKLLRSE